MPDTSGSAKAKRVVITGATRGLGRALAVKFAALGHTVIGCGRSAADVERLNHDLGAPHAFDVVDVTRDDQVKSWADGFLGRSGAPDLLLNNAALINPNAPLWEVSAEDFDRVIDVNLKGVANVIRHVVPAMIARGAGVIVNFSSGWGRSVSRRRRPLLLHQVGRRGSHPRPRRGTPRRHGGRASEPRHHRHRDAPQHLRRFRLAVPPPREMGRGRRAVLARARPQGQRQATHRAGAVELTHGLRTRRGAKTNAEGRGAEGRGKRRRGKREEGGGKPGLLGLPPFLVLLLPFFLFPLSSSPSGTHSL